MLVHKDHVPRKKLLEGEAVAIQFAQCHGDTVLYPAGGGSRCQAFEVQAAVADCLPLAMLLNTDVPQMANLLQEKMELATEPKIVSALVVTS